jgi:4'-phosphopantetheinyl transferase
MREPCLQTVAGVTLDVTAVDEATRDRAADRAALVALAATVLGVDAATLRLDRRCPHCGGVDHGRPTIADAAVSVSLARTDGVRALAVSTVGDVGIDVERVSRVRRAPLDAFTVAECAEIDLAPDPDRRRTELWAAKEAILKAEGTGLRIDPRTVEVARHGSHVRIVDVGIDGDVVVAVAHRAATEHADAHGAVAQSAGTASA